MTQNFIACDRDQPFLMPPSLLDWVPEDHLVWTILGSVAEMDLAAFYSGYRADGHGRPAYEPSMMVSLLLYAYARGNRSSRGIERECVEDVAYRVIATNLVPDHSTIAEFRRRHETALAELFTGVLRLCNKAGLVNVGVIAIDGTKVKGNASHRRNRDYEHLVRGILAEADRIDREEDERHGDKRGDELPEQLQTAEGRKAALKEAKQKLDRERERDEPEKLESDSDEQDQAAPSDGLGLELDAEVIVARTQGREGWLREAKRQTDERRKQQAWPIPRSRPERLLEAERRMQEDLAVERAANAAYEHFRATGRDKGGRRLSSHPPKPYTPPDEPAGPINTTDPDSHNMQTAKGWVQGYNAQAAVTENQIVIAAEVMVRSPDFGYLEPIVTATEGELEKVGVTDAPGVIVADAGYWHQQQMDEVIANKHIPLLIPPDADRRKGTKPRPGWDGGQYAFMRRVLATEHGGGIYRKRQSMIEPIFGDIKFNRQIDQFHRRGRCAARSEWRLITATHNLIKLHKHQIATAGA
jgi:transposase